MKYVDIIDAIQKQINETSPIMERLSYLQAVPTRNVGDKPHYSRIELNAIATQIDLWQSKTMSELAKCFPGNNDFKARYAQTRVQNRLNFDDKKELEKEISDGISVLEVIIQEVSQQAENKKEKIQPSKARQQNRPPKVFISHKQEDKAFADALVSLINFLIGSDGNKIFCSSIPGYGIQPSQNILDKLKEQFDNNEVYMIIVHSPRYYQSSVCLNEMGAAWVLGTRFSSFLTKDCKPDDMRGVINKEAIFINVNDTPDMLNAHLNDFKNDIIQFFGAKAVDENKWENARSRFINEVTALQYPKNISKEDNDLFDTWYLPAFSRIFELLDLEHYQQWTYPCALGGHTTLYSKNYNQLEEIPNYILGRPRHSGFSSFDSLMRNLGLLVSDFLEVFSQHVRQLDDKRYYVEPFYKLLPNNPNYDEDAEAYRQHVLLVSDMLFELTRLCNLLLDRIRGIYPEYRTDIGLLHIDNQISTPDLVYRDDEISDAPYPGLEKFIKIRMNRETHLGTNPNIGINGYEKNRS